MPIVAPTSLGSAVGLPPVYHSQLFVKKDSPYVTVEDLRGARFAYNDDTSLSGYYCVVFFLLAYRRQMKSENVPFFSYAMKTGAHINSIRAVLDGHADVFALDCNVLNSLQQDENWRENLNGIRPVYAPELQYSIDTASFYTVSKSGLLGPHPAQPVVVSRSLDPSLIAGLTDAFLAVPREALVAIRCEQFMRVDEEYYRSITAMIQACEGLDLLV